MGSEAACRPTIRTKKRGWPPKEATHKKKKKKSGAALEEDVANLMSLDPRLEEGGVHVPDASKKKKKKKKKRSAVDAAPGDA